jgi:hypothetical protein
MKPTRLLPPSRLGGPATPHPVGTAVADGPRCWAWRPIGRALAAIIAMAAITLLAAACGGSPASHVAQLGSTTTRNSASHTATSSNIGGRTGSQSMSAQMLPFGHCMRSHGVPNFPDPDNSAKFPGAQSLGVSGPVFQGAYNTCKHLLPTGGGGAAQAQLQQQMNAMLPFARCMRSNGVPDWPDLSIYTNSDGETSVVFNFIGTSLDGNGFNTPQVQAKINACQRLLPPSHGGPPYRIVRSHG